MDASLLTILCCPETRQSLTLADRALVERLNQQITQGALKNRGGELLKQLIDEGLVRADGKFLYPVREQIPIMLVNEAIPLRLDAAP